MASKFIGISTGQTIECPLDDYGGWDLVLYVVWLGIIYNPGLLNGKPVSTLIGYLYINGQSKASRNRFFLAKKSD